MECLVSRRSSAAAAAALQVVLEGNVRSIADDTRRSSTQEVPVLSLLLFGSFVLLSYFLKGGFKCQGMGENDQP